MTLIGYKGRNHRQQVGVQRVKQRARRAPVVDLVERAARGGAEGEALRAALEASA